MTEQQLVRKEKVDKLVALGISPYASKYQRTNIAIDICNKYADKSNEELEALNIFVCVAGRIVLKRGQGKAGFFHLMDLSGKIQCYARMDTLSEIEWAVYNLADLGDIVGIKGVLFRTKMGELTINVLSYTHLSKAITPLPDKYHGLQDIEETRRRRYVDLIVNENSRELALLRPKIIKAIRMYFDAKGFLEVDTPVLSPILGGATARPFVTHHNALDMPFYLRIATELPLKKLIVGGLEAVYEIGRLFRNEGMDSTHNPEFTTVEAYLAYADVSDMMDLIEDFFKYVTTKVFNSSIIRNGDYMLDFNQPFKRVHMVDLINETTGIDFFKVSSSDEAIKLAKKHMVPIKKYFTYGHIVEAFFEHYCEDKIIEPTIVFGHPIEISPLAKKNEKDSRFTDRFELFILGKEYANAFSELNDPFDQRERFEAQIKQKEMGNDEANEMDVDFVEALEYGLPPTGGIGIGIDRLVMLLSNTNSIRDVILFPHLKNR